MADDREMSVESSLVVLRCSECGDTFPVLQGDQVCPSCGSAEVDAASEPLL
jgi:Zn finger protein HypA/HybF involved in hydrogenase expression